MQVDVINRVCRYYHPLIMEQSVIYIAQQLRLRPVHERATASDVERVFLASAGPLFECLRSPSSDVHEKVEGFAMLRGFHNIFYTHGLFKLVAEACSDTETRQFLTTKIAPLDSKGVDSLHKAIRNASMGMVVLSKGRELIKKWAALDVDTCCDGSPSDTATMECCLEPPVMQTDFLRDIPFKIMRKCLPLEIATESAFVEYIMHLIVLQTFNKGQMLVDAARKKLMHVAGPIRTMMLLNLVRSCEDEGIYPDLMSKVRVKS